MQGHHAYEKITLKDFFHVLLITLSGVEAKKVSVIENHSDGGHNANPTYALDCFG